MRATGLKAKLAANQPTIGSWITLAHNSIAEIMAANGFDWLVIDVEHSVIELSQAQDLIRTIESFGVAPIVRLTSNDENQIKRVMDSGAHGIMVPMVNSVADAERAVAAMHYPPRGRRGVGLARAHGYGTSFAGYKDWLEQESVLVVMN